MCLKFMHFSALPVLCTFPSCNQSLLDTLAYLPPPASTGPSAWACLQAAAWADGGEALEDRLAALPANQVSCRGCDACDLVDDQWRAGS